MILLINICKEELHYFEFVKPIHEIAKEYGVVEVCHYKDLEKKQVDEAEKIIICGTSLKDNCFLKDLERFEWLKNIDKPVLGICGGMQIIGLIFGGKLEKGKEVGMKKIRVEKEFFGLNEKEVYELHGNIIVDLPGFEILARNEFIQAIKHREKEIYGVLFHPEVSQKIVVSKFCEL